MNKLCLLFLLFFGVIQIVILNARTIICVPDDYPTIQEGINAADSSDVVLVSPGIYTENINIYSGSITVASLFYTTHDPVYIVDTIIDGGEVTHTVSFTNAAEETILTGFTITNGSAPRGGGIICDSSSIILSDLIITGNVANIYGGGGVYINNDSNVQIENVIIENNIAEHEGGGIYISNLSEVYLVGVTIRNNNAYWFGGGIMTFHSNLYLESSSIHNNFAPEKGGGICCYTGSEISFNADNRCSIYSNHSNFASDIFTDVLMDVIVDTFTIDEPTAGIAAPIENLSFDILNPLHEHIMCDLYVSPEGDDLNSGTSEDDPLRTISLATIIIQADGMEPHTVWIAEGIYSPLTNGDSFPIVIPPNITLSGNSMENTILDANNTAGILSFVDSNNSGANNLTLKHGRATYGGGIYCSYSSPLLENLIIEENTYLETYSQGGGIACSYSSPIINNTIIRGNNSIHGGGLFCEHISNPQLNNVIIENNRAICNGGGIRSYFSSAPTLTNVSILHNQAGELGGGIATTSGLGTLENVDIRFNQSLSDGGGIYLYGNNPLFRGVNITNNQSAAGGGIYISNALPVFDPEDRCNIYLNNTPFRDNGCDIFYYDQSNTYNVIVDTFTVMDPTDYHACPASQINFDIINAVYEQIESDLYVSPDGDNSNSGIDPEEPFKTIQYAAMLIQANAEHPRIIHLADGTYSPLTNEEYFPINLPSYVTLEGESFETTIIDAMNLTGVITINNADSIQISNLAICNGNTDNGGGIKCLSSSLSLNNVLMTGNYATYNGGAINICYNSSSLSLYKVIISNNCADRGGAIYSYNSNVNNLVNVTISNNHANEGAAIYCNGSNFYMLNCLIWDYIYNEIVFESNWLASLLMITYSDIFGGYENINTTNNCIIDWMDGNITMDPLFADPWLGYVILDDSPCVNTGTAYFEYNDAVILDLDESEYIGIAPDMGAWEFNPVEADESLIHNSKLKIQNYPNPFNPETNISFSIDQEELVKIEIYNIKGQKVTEICNEKLSAGQHNIVWNALDTASGLYFLSFNAGDKHYKHKMVLIK